MDTLSNLMILSSMATASKDWHWCLRNEAATQIPLVFTCILFFWHRDLRHFFITHIGLCNQPRHQDSELLCHRKETPLCSPFILTPCTTPGPWQPSRISVAQMMTEVWPKSLWQNYDRRVINKVNKCNSCGWLFFILHDILKTHPNRCLDQQFIYFPCWILFLHELKTSCVIIHLLKAM